MNNEGFFKRIFQSLFLRLLVLYSLTFILIVLGLSIGFRVSRPAGGHEFFRTNLETYSRYLIEDIGSPPDLTRAKELNLRTGLEIAIRGPDLNWSSNPELAKRVESLRSTKKTRFLRKQRLIRTSKGGYEFFFAGPDWAEEGHSLGFTIALIMTALILWLNYLVTRAIFRPLDRMKVAAAAFGEGKWETRVPVSGPAELADLGSTMNAMAERIQKQFNSMRELLIAISHELRSPLTRMKVALEFLPDPKLRASLDEEIMLLDRMTESLLEQEKISSRPDLLQRELIDLGELVKKVVSPYLKLEPGVHFESRLEKTELPLDEARFGIALRNLVENALKHASHPKEKPIVRLGRDETGVFFEVQDFGPGIPQDAISRLGEPFFRVEQSRTGERKQGGFGLGLSLAYSIFKAHGAVVKINSVENKGTVFRVELAKA